MPNPSDDIDNALMASQRASEAAQKANPKNFYDRLTNEQTGVVDSTSQAMLEDVALCAKRLVSAQLAVVPMPWINEAGQAVQHGCNEMVMTMVEYWYERMVAAYRAMPRGAFKRATGFNMPNDVLSHAKAEWSKRYEPKSEEPFNYNLDAVDKAFDIGPS